MRQALNDNPIVQLAMVGLLLVVGVLFVLPQVKGGGSSEQPAPATATTTTPTAATTGGATSTTVSPTTTATTGESPSLTATPPPPQPLPRPVMRAYDHGETVVVLVVRAGGIVDPAVRDALQALRGESGMTVFVTRARHIARYSAITQGAGVDRVPALVVLPPKALSGGSSEATVVYGFQSPQTVLQAVDDAIYHGPTVGYAPGDGADRQGQRLSQ